jgi:hypothetical protein
MVGLFVSLSLLFGARRTKNSIFTLTVMAMEPEKRADTLEIAMLGLSENLKCIHSILMAI